jgi:hypothetical protein
MQFNIIIRTTMKSHEQAGMKLILSWELKDGKLRRRRLNKRVRECFKVRLKIGSNEKNCIPNYYKKKII